MASGSPIAVSITSSRSSSPQSTIDTDTNIPRSINKNEDLKLPNEQPSTLTLESDHRFEPVSNSPTEPSPPPPSESSPSLLAAYTSVKFIRNSKRSSSASNDLLFERDRFRARLHNFNITLDDNINELNEQCEVCDLIGTKTTKLNVMKDDGNNVSLDDTNSPLCVDSSFFQQLPDIALFDDVKTKSNCKLINMNDLNKIFTWYFNKPLPLTSSMFPWLHGLHEDNFAQRQFFIHQRRQQLKLRDFSSSSLDEFNIELKPDCRFLMCINSDTMENSDTLLKNNIFLNEILCPIDVSRGEVIQLVEKIVDEVFSDSTNKDRILETFLKDVFRLKYLPVFLNLDPDRGVSLRNFHIQVTKLAVCSDFVIYCLKEDQLEDCYSIARILWLTQRFEYLSTYQENSSQFNVFILKHFDGSELHNDLTTICLNDGIINKNYDCNKLMKVGLPFLKTWDSEYAIKEKVETIKMSSATRMFGSLFSGNSWDYQNFINYRYSNQHLKFERKSSNFKHLYCNPLNSIVSSHYNDNDLIETVLPLPNLKFKLFINCYNEAQFPNTSNLDSIMKIFNSKEDISDYFCLSFPSSGSIGIGDCKKDNIISILNTCKLLYLATIERGHDTLIYCSDGYTELSLLNLFFIVYSQDCLVDDAIVDFHTIYGRPFYIFNTDVLILRKLESCLRQYSPRRKSTDWTTLDILTNYEVNNLLLSPSKVFQEFRPRVKDMDVIDTSNELMLSSSSSSSNTSSLSSLSSDNDSFDINKYQLDWCKEVEGSLPSRILPYLYLGSLKHANCLPLLSKLGIKKVISVGEPLYWLSGSNFQKHHDIMIHELNDGDVEIYNIIPNNRSNLTVDEVMKVNNLQDDGIDQLESSLPVILKYIDDEYIKSNGQTKILVHCRVGVSRSATVAIAEVMKRLKVNLPQAYLYVRVRRLNIIIQPNLKFMYELFKWEESQNRIHNNQTHSREIDWFALCREITLLNNPYLS